MSFDLGSFLLDLAAGAAAAAAGYVFKLSFRSYRSSDRETIKQSRINVGGDFTGRDRTG
jgi:hypothetical protein